MGLGVALLRLELARNRDGLLVEKERAVLRFKFCGAEAPVSRAPP